MHGTPSIVEAWATTIGILLGLVLVLHTMGYDVTGSIGNALHGMEQLLNRPLTLA